MSTPTPELQSFPILPSSGTKLTCSECGTDEAVAFYLKHRRSLYALLCFKNGRGCWERSARNACEYIDEHQMQCQLLSEWEVVYGEHVAKARCCTGHVGLFLTDHPVMHVYPLED